MHDPLCDWQPGEPQPDGSVLAWTCQCETIAKARADQTERITSAVDALPFKCALSLEPADCNQSCDDGPCSCSGIRREVAWTTARSDVLDAIAAAEAAVVERDPAAAMLEKCIDEVVALRGRRDLDPHTQVECERALQALLTAASARP